MKYNEYYNKNVMNFRQLALDLKKQGFRCEISEDGNYLLVYYLCFSDYARNMSFSISSLECSLLSVL